MMDLDSAIKHCEEVAKEQESHGYCDRSLCVIMDVNNATCDECEAVKCRECASEHRQLAEWLKELKVYKEQQPCEDVISREDALKALCQAVHKNDDSIPCPNQRVSCLWNKTKVQDYAEEILKLPSTTPQRKIGRWIEGYEWVCSNCGTLNRALYKCCSHCGKMEVKE